MSKNYDSKSVFAAANTLQEQRLDTEKYQACRKLCIDTIVASFGAKSGFTLEENYEFGVQQLREAAQSGIRREDIKGYEASLGDEAPHDSLIFMRPTVVEPVIASITEIYASLTRGFIYPKEESDPKN